MIINALFLKAIIPSLTWLYGRSSAPFDSDREQTSTFSQPRITHIDHAIGFLDKLVSTFYYFLRSGKMKMLYVAVICIFSISFSPHPNDTKKGGRTFLCLSDNDFTQKEGNLSEKKWNEIFNIWINLSKAIFLLASSHLSIFCGKE